ncbi:MAG TPA: hypothetical protein VEI81_05495 [Methanoregula sp.]|nr:hypothetical protein [Methanoregula sp.]
MDEAAVTVHVAEIMRDFARITGLEPGSDPPRRYLWTDAFAVCNFLELSHRTGDTHWRDLAERLVWQVHHTLGRHRSDDYRKGWISGLSESEGELHPTRGGLRIGKPLGERKPDDPYDDRLEWDQDGQYFHYLTKWMHALNRMSRVTKEQKYNQWAIELAQAAHTAFTFVPPSGGRPRMCWKMSIDLSRPLVPSMGQHDPLDGFLTYSELQVTAEEDFGQAHRQYLGSEIALMAAICRSSGLATDDPLGLGGLLADAFRAAQLMARTGGHTGLAGSILNAAAPGVRAFATGDTVRMPPEHRLAFRELGLAIGLAGVTHLNSLIGHGPVMYGGDSQLRARVRALAAYDPLRQMIMEFWLDERSRAAATWVEHREINMVMLATSLAPGGFLTI